MRILLDTNICLDILQNRQEFYDSSKNALFLASERNFKLYITTTTVMDIMYITRKYFQDNNQQRNVVYQFITAFRILKISSKDIKYGFSGIMKDFEDAVQANCSKANHIKYIVTRNTKDYVNSPIKAITPEDFIKQFK